MFLFTVFLCADRGGTEPPLSDAGRLSVSPSVYPLASPGKQCAQPGLVWDVRMRVWDFGCGVCGDGC